MALTDHADPRQVLEAPERPAELRLARAADAQDPVPGAAAGASANRIIPASSESYTENSRL
jgi:hypothetical protein